MPISRSAKSLHRTLPCAAELQNGRQNATKMHFCLCDSCVAAEKRRLQFTIWMSGTGNVRRAIHWLFSGIVSVILIVQLSFERWTLEKHSIFGE